MANWKSENISRTYEWIQTAALVAQSEQVARRSQGVFCSVRNEVFGLKSAHALSDCRIVGFTQACVDGSLTFEVGSDQ
jgi:hypothetical protein